MKSVVGMVELVRESLNNKGLALGGGSVLSDGACSLGGLVSIKPSDNDDCGT